MSHRHGAVRDRVEHLQTRHQLARAEHLNPEFAAGRLGNILRHILCRAVDRSQAFRIAGRQAPLDFRQFARACRGDCRCTGRHAKSGLLQE
jgi:hypothetical protein